MSPAAKRWYGRLVLLLLTVAVFALAFLLNASPDRFVRPALDELGAAAEMKVDYARSAIRLSGIVLEKVALLPSEARQPYRIERVVARPSLTGLIAGRRGSPWTLDANLYGGTARAIVENVETGWQTEITWSTIDLGRIDGLVENGKLDGTVDGRVVLPAGEPETGTWEIRGHGLTAVGLAAGRLEFPRVSVEELTSEGTWQGRRATVSALDAHGSFGRVQLSGRIVLRQPSEKSALNMTLEHTPPERLDPEFQFLMRMLLPPGAVPGGRYRVSGTLGGPALSPITG